MSDQAFKFSGEAAASYDEYLGPFLFEPSARIMAAFMPENYKGEVLELAAGTGRLTRHLAKKLAPEGKLVATDVSSDMLGIAENKLKGQANLIFENADAAALPYETESFDLVFFQYGIMFLENKMKAMEEAFRVLRPGGKLFMSTWDDTSRMPFFKLLFNDILLPFFKSPDKRKYVLPFLMHEPKELVRLLENAGFRDVEVNNRRFTGTSPAPSELVKGFLLKHSLAKEVMEQDPGALMLMAETLQSRIADQFGPELVSCELSAFFCRGEKPIQKLQFKTPIR